MDNEYQQWCTHGYWRSFFETNRGMEIWGDKVLWSVDSMIVIKEITTLRYPSTLRALVKENLVKDLKLSIFSIIMP